MRRVLVVALTFLLMSAAWVVQAQSADDLPEVPVALSSSSIPCPMGAPLGETEGQTIVCGQIVVPENWAEPDGRQITIRYARLMAKATVPFSDPVIYFEGGPGGTALGGVMGYLQAYERLREDRDVILWDQRGTLYSSQVLCPDDARVSDPSANVAGMSDFIMRVQALGIPTLEDGPEKPLEIQRLITTYDQIANCPLYFESQGIDITQYNTANTVLDTIALLGALGAPSYNLHAISYGTTVALALMQYYTDHPGANLPPIRSAVVDGLFPLNYSFTNEEYINPLNVLRVFSDCEADPACAAAYPNIRQRAIDLLPSLDAAPLTLADGTVLDGKTLGEYLIAVVLQVHSAVPYMPRMIAEIEQGNTETIDLVNTAISMGISLSPGEVTEQPVSMMGAGVPELTVIAAGLRDTAMQIELIGLQASVIRDVLLNTQDPSEQYLGMLDRYLKLVGVSQASSLKNILENFVLDPDRQTRGNLRSLTSNVGMSAVQRQMQTLVDTMSDDEIAEVFTGLTSREFFGQITGFNTLFNSIVNCNDRAASIDADVAFEAYRAYEIPDLLVGFTAVAYRQAQCEALGLTADAYQPPPPGAVSDIPTLVVNGALDSATPAESGELVMQTLTNAQMITFPRLTHGATIQSYCSIDLTYNFIMYPDRDLDLTCLNDLQLPFVLPGDPLPVLPGMP